MDRLNFISIALIVLAVWPLISGLFMRFSRDGIRIALWSLMDNVVLILGIMVSIYLTRRIFFQHSDDFFQHIYNLIPTQVRILLYGQDVLIYLGVGSIVLLLLTLVFRPILVWIYQTIVTPMAFGCYDALARSGPVVSGVARMLTQVPRAAFTVFMVSLGLSFLSYYAPIPALSGSMNDSSLYQAVYRDAICPVLHSNLAKKIPVIVNDAFGQRLPGAADSGEMADATGGVQSNGLTGGGPVVAYFNGVTLDKAVQSNRAIDQLAVEIAGSEKNSKRKAYALYRWTAENITYDEEKAARLAQNPRGIQSGSIVAFETRQGVCFDYASLYVSMCRAAGLKVRLVTGQAYSGTAWGDHAWNQVYLPEEDRWINVDATFGCNDNYFDKLDFVADHRFAQVQQTW